MAGARDGRVVLARGQAHCARASVFHPELDGLHGIVVSALGADEPRALLEKIGASVLDSAVGKAGHRVSRDEPRTPRTRARRSLHLALRRPRVRH
jgi:hypothetical protein